jgi:hypothetical protein
VNAINVVSCMTMNVILLFSLLCTATTVHSYPYNSPDCPSWPSEETWGSELGDLLSSDAALHGPIPETAFATDCRTLGTNAYAISQGGNGICTHAFACEYEFCRDGEGFQQNIPQFVAEVKTAQDIQAALAFAQTYDIQVSVKTTGHSYHGASTARNSLLIWMQNYPKDGAITTDFVDSCGTSYDAVVGINGGETWNDVLEAVKGDYHIVTGGGRTVSAAGGWLMGSGLSFSSRQYGLGVDQVVTFDLVLTNGTMVQVDGCTNPELFWALRGGGGGTFGVVTNVRYMLHPPTPITVLNWNLQGIEYLFENELLDELQAFVYIWLTYWTEISPTLETRWSGFFGPTGATLYFSGNLEDATASFINDFDDWYSNTLIPNTNFIPGAWGAFPPSSSVEVKSSWYESKGGASAYSDPDQTDATGDAYNGVEFIAARLMPLQMVVNEPERVRDAMFDLAITGALGDINYFLGGKINDVDEESMALNPAHRRAIWSVFTNSDEARDRLTSFIPNNVTGVCFNHHSPSEPDWRNACWGPHYARLEALKNKYDPNRVFNCWHCPGYVGEENPALVSSVDSRDSAPGYVGEANPGRKSDECFTSAPTAMTPSPMTPTPMTPSPTPASSTRAVSSTTAQTMCMLVVALSTGWLLEFW